MHASRFVALLFCLALAAQCHAGQPKKPNPNLPKAPAPASDGSETAVLPVTGMM